MKVFSELIKFGCDFVLSMVALSVEVLFREGRLGKGGGLREKRRLSTGGSPGRVHPRRWWHEHWLRLVTHGRGDEPRAGGEGESEGLGWWWVEGRGRVDWGQRGRRRACL